MIFQKKKKLLKKRIITRPRLQCFHFLISMSVACIVAIYYSTSLQITINDSRSDNDFPIRRTSTTTNMAMIHDQSEPSSNVESLQTLEQVWIDYKRWHSVDNLQKEFKEKTHNNTISRRRRKYQVIYYTCPQASGNYLHDVFNQVIVAIATNRTMLFKYYDTETCWAISKQSRRYENEECPMGGGVKPNQEHDCSRILIRKSWIPAFDEWISRIQEQQQPSSTNSTTLVLPKRQGGTRAPSHWHTSSIVAFKAMIFPQLMWRHQQFLTSTESSNILEKLYSFPNNQILYGKIFREVFDIHPQILPPEYCSNHNHTTLSKNVSVVKSYALHSRHIFPSDNGSNTENERKCLKEVIGNDIDSNQLQCIVYLMSDRDLNRQLVADYIRKQWPQCTPVMTTYQNNTQHNTTPSSHNGITSKEHGAAAGAGFFQDLAVASQARDGFIGTCSRTSSALLSELIYYDRSKESFKETGAMPKTSLRTCCLQNDDSARATKTKTKRKR